MRQIIELGSLLPRNLERIYGVAIDDVDDSDMVASSTSEFSENLSNAFDSNTENEDDTDPSSWVNSDQKRNNNVVPLKRKLYSKTEISRELALEQLANRLRFAR